MKHQKQFVATISVQDQKEIRSWFVISALLITGIIFICMVWDATFIAQWWSIRSSYKSQLKQASLFDSAVNEKKQLVDALAKINKEQAKITHYKKQVKNPAPLLHALYSCADKVTLHSVNIQQKKMKIEIAAPTESTIFAWSEQIKKVPIIQELQLQQLRKTKPTEFGATFQAKLKYSAV